MCVKEKTPWDDEATVELIADISNMPASVDCIVAEAEYLRDKGYRKKQNIGQELLDLADTYGAGVWFYQKIRAYANGLMEEI